MRVLKNVRSVWCNCPIVIMCLLMAAALLGMTAAADGAGKPKTVAEIALYQGPDREKLLLEGARKEGQLTLYDSHTGIKIVSQEFEKKYPFIKVSEWRTESKEAYTRVMEEYAAGRFLVDVVEMTELIVFLQREGILQEYYTPHMLAYGDMYKGKGDKGVYYLADREIYLGLGFNTERVNPAEAPKQLRDLLDPKWKGKISIAGTKTSYGWMGNALEAAGRDFLEKLSMQEVKVQNISNAALLGLIASGEVPLSPTIFRDNVFGAKKKGAPVEWRPMEPAVTNIGSSGIATKAPHPYTAMLFLDYLHSKEGQQAVMNLGPSSPRNDMTSPEAKFKKTIWQARYTPEEFEKKINEWEGLSRKYFLKGK